jgi:ligand-binding sensor domain-containing protein
MSKTWYLSIFLITFSAQQLHSQTFTIYNTANSGLPANWVGELETHNGELWISTLEGLVNFDGVNWVVYDTTNSGLQHQIITDIAIASNGDVWVANYDEGVAMFDGLNWVNYNVSNSSLSNNLLTSITVDDLDDIWIGTYSGLDVFNGAIWTSYNTLNSSIPDDKIQRIDFTSNGDIWVPTWFGGVSFFNGSTWTSYSTANSPLQVNSAPVVKVDQNDDVWIGTTQGLAFYDGSSWTVFDSGNSPLVTDDIRALDIGPNGEIIIGCNLGGLTIYDGITWTNYNTGNSSMPSDQVWGLKYDSTSASLWVGTSNGLVNITNLASFEKFGDLITINCIPNPTSGNLQIHHPFNKGEIHLINEAGQALLTKPIVGIGSIELNLSAYPSGYYFIKIIVDNNSWQERIVLIK